MGADNYVSSYNVDQPERADIDALHGTTVLEFGADWCPICQGAQSLIRTVVAEHPEVRHLKVEDGRGRPLGRSFRIKLWPTLIVLKDGVEVGRAVRPEHASEVRDLLAAIAAG